MEQVEDEVNSFDFGDDSYRVRLQKSADGTLGLAYRADLDGLLVTGIIVNSAVDEWNRTSDAERYVCVGDKIVGVNGVRAAADAKTVDASNCEALVAEIGSALRKGGGVLLEIKKFGPRWHVEGTTADCIEKVNLAMDSGLKLELVTPDQGLLDDDLLRDSEFKKMSRGQGLMMLGVIALPSLLLVAVCSDMGMGFALYGAFSGSMMNMAGNGIIFLCANLTAGMYIVDWHKWESKVQRGVTALMVLYGMCLGGVMKCRFYPSAPPVVILFHLPVVIGVLRATALKQVQRASFYRGVSVSTLLTGLSILGLWLAWMNLGAWDGVNLYNDATKAKLVEQSAPLYDNTLLTFNETKRSLDYTWDCKDKMETDFDILYGVPVNNGYNLTQTELKTRAANCGQVKTIWFLLWMSPFITTMTNLVIATFCALNASMGNVDDTSKAEKALKQFILMVAVLLLAMWVATSVAGASMRLTGTLMAFCGAGVAALFIWMYFEVGSKLINSTLKTSKIMTTLVSVVTNDWFRACFIIAFNVALPMIFLVEVVKQKVRKLRKSTTSRAWLTPEATTALEFFQNWRWGAIFVKANWIVILYWTLSVGVAKVTVLFLSWLNEEFEGNIPFWAVCTIFFLIGYTMFLLPPVPGIPVYITSGIIIAAQARTVDEVGGYYGGIVIAIILSFVLKLCAVCGQYSIGYFMGKSVKVQQLVMVDQVPTRSIEKILMKKGLNLGKVSVLVGGPDWPTSVLCGILRLSLFQCCLGTVPVILVSSPCVLAGAFMASPSAELNDNDKSMWDALANTALAVSALGQLASGVLAMYFIQDTIAKNSEELAKPRPEHEKVKQLTLAEADFQDCYAEVMEWRRLPKFWFVLISTSAGTMIFSFFIFFLMDEACFKNFQVKDRISDPEGLNCPGNLGCALVGILKDDPPIGWGAMGLFFTACILHFIFLKYVGRKAKALLAYKKANNLLGRNSRNSERSSQAAALAAVGTAA